CFLSSRRRHTRSKRDWSSDVCSSDLGETQSHIFFFLPAELPGVFICLKDFLSCFLFPCILFHYFSNKIIQIKHSYPGMHVFKIRSEERRVGKECRVWVEHHHSASQVT